MVNFMLNHPIRILFRIRSNVIGQWYIQRPGFPVERRVGRPGDERMVVKRTHLWVFAHQSAVSSADVVIALGGSIGTERAVYTSETIGVPVLPIAAFGGGAARGNKELKVSHRDHPKWHYLTADWASNHGEAIISLAEAIGHHSYFLSYSHRQMSWCDFVHLALYERSRTTLRDRNQLRAGKPVESKLYEAIGRAETFVLLWSNSSAKSDWCQKELEVALELNSKGLPPHRIVLLMRDKMTLPSEAKDHLQLRAQTRNQTDQAIRRLVEEERDNT